MVEKLTRRAFIILAAGAAGVVAAGRAIAHHRPGHNHGPKPKPTTTPPPTTTTTPPPPTTTPPPPSGVFGPTGGVAAVRSGAGPRTVLDPIGVSFSNLADLQTKMEEDPDRIFVREEDA